MKLQEQVHGCGAAALCNALEAIGVKLSQAAAARLAKTSHVGTDDQGLTKAIELLGGKAHRFQTENDQGGWAALCGFLNMGMPVLLCVDEEDHWVSAIGLLGGLVVVVDSAEAEMVLTYRRPEILARWCSGGRKATYFGIAIERG